MMKITTNHCYTNLKSLADDAGDCMNEEGTWSNREWLEMKW